MQCVRAIPYVCLVLFSNTSNMDKFTEMSFWTNSWLSFLTLVEEQPMEIFDKSSLWLTPLMIPDESSISCLPEWTATERDSSSEESPMIDSKWNNILSPPHVNIGSPFDLNGMSTDEIVSLTNEPVLGKNKTKLARLIETPRGKTPLNVSRCLEHGWPTFTFGTVDTQQTVDQYEHQQSDEHLSKQNASGCGPRFTHLHSESIREEACGIDRGQ
jgi:hypothetical protein